jgi:predicted alpha/beta-fold hydrolase
MSLRGHAWTLGAYLRRWLQPPNPPPSEDWEGVVEDPHRGTLRLTGKLSLVDSAEGLVVLLHGLGGCAESSYLAQGAQACVAAGLSCLRLNLRGADRQGEDVYHAGLTADLRAAVTSPVARSHGAVWVIGYSMGGHIALRMAVEDDDSPVRAVAAICPPIDLLATARLLDSPSRWPYRVYLLRQLTEIYSEVARRHTDGPSVEEVAAVRTFVEFDGLVVAPRYGFRNARDYYRRASVGPLLSRLRVPSLIVGATEDPMVPTESLSEVLESPPRNLQVAWSSRGGHLAFPRSLKLDRGDGGHLEAQIVEWLQRQP